MAKAKPSQKSDGTCPQCGDTLVEHRAATAAEHAAFTNRENPVTLPPRVDTASPAQRAELGPLFVCRGCGYETRVEPVDGDGKPAAAAE